MEKTIHQKALTNLVQAYKRLMPEEFREFKRAQELKVQLNRNQFGVADGSQIRKVYEIPETLFNIFQENLSDETVKYLQSKEGQSWFAKTFKEFRSSDVV